MAATEIFDVVDQRDNPVGRAPRCEVHARGLRHRAVHILVFDPPGRLYLQRRAEHKDSEPGLWDTSAAGHVLSGEDYDAAARRELAEELALSAVALERLFKLEATVATGNEFTWVYRYESAVAPRPNADEIAEGRWLTHAELARCIERRPEVFSAAFRTIWRYLGQGQAYLPAAFCRTADDEF